MNSIRALFIGMFLVTTAILPGEPQAARHTFALSGNDFLLDGKPFQILSGELHPARIPVEYWRHRIQMVRALGCNTIAAYIFWNYHEAEPGKFDFESGNRNISRFIKIAQEEGMWVLLRPGPYVCAEWDFGGLPPYLLKLPDIKVRCMDPRYMAAAGRYMTRLATLAKPLMVKNGGPILMVQIENEYGSYGNDRQYLEELRKTWITNGIDGPFYTADGATPHMLEAGNIDGAAIGLDPGDSEKAFSEAKTRNPDVPAFSSETYPGWLTHWGEKWARPDPAALLREIRFLLATGRSLNLYVAHGGTNFEFTAGANDGGKGYEPDITSYDYDAPIDEQGRAASKYQMIRDLISEFKGAPPAIPQPIPAMDIPPIAMSRSASLWENLPPAETSVQPQPMEAFGQNQGLILYRTRLSGHKSGKLNIKELHDYALVFVDGVFAGKLDRREGESSAEIPRGKDKNPVLDILVEAMGRINFGPAIIDRKGITERVTLNRMTLMNWEVFKLPLDGSYISSLQPAGATASRPGLFFKGTFELSEVADTFFDMTGYKKGIVWVNGHNLGRYWEIGPQKRLYCPGPWLKKGRNEILVFDLHVMEPATVKGMRTLE